MKLSAKWFIVATAFIAFMSNFAYAGPLSGSLSGTVKDYDGRPLVEALVFVHEGNLTEKALKLAKTDKYGKFLATNLTSGRYTLLVKAAGFKPEQIAATVIPHQTAIFDFKLRRVSELLTEQEDLDSYKYVLKRNRSIFQLDKSEEIAQAKEEPPTIPEPHGMVSFIANKSISNHSGASSFSSFNFALEQMVTDNLELVVAGQTGFGQLAPQRLETQASYSSGNDHIFNLSLGFNHLPLNRAEVKNSSFNQYTLRATDRWHIAGPVVIVYGFDYSRLEGRKKREILTPRVNLDLQVSRQDAFYAAIYSPDGADIESTANFETTKVNFYGPVKFIGFEPEPTPIKRYEVGYSHSFKNHARLDVALLYDKLLGEESRGLDFDTNDDFPDEINKDDQKATTSKPANTRALRLIFKQPIGDHINASFGYALAKGQELGLNSSGQPTISCHYFQVFTGKVDTQFISTGTQISAVLRLSTPQGILTLDPFQDRLKTLDPNISIFITQEMPMFGFIPGRWQATLDARNIFDSTGNGDDRTRQLIGQYWRSIRGGFSVKF